jgi:hypothetical protein
MFGSHPVLEERQLHRVIKEYVEYFNQAPPHQGIGQRIPGRLESGPEKLRKAKIIAFPVLNGFRHDYRLAVDFQRLHKRLWITFLAGTTHQLGAIGAAPSPL